MTFVEIVNAVLADAFAEGKRDQAKNWVNNRYAWICALEEWSFLKAAVAVTVTSGSMTVTGLPAALGPVIALLDQYGNPLEPVRDYQTFYDRYTGASTSPGQPEAFTVIGASVLVGPASNFTGSFTLIHEQVPVPLSADTDVPIIPAGYHMALVKGGKALGFRATNVPLAAELDAEFRGDIDAMRGTYLTPIRDKQRQSPAYRPC